MSSWAQIPVVSRSSSITRPKICSRGFTWRRSESQAAEGSFPVREKSYNNIKRFRNRSGRFCILLVNKSAIILSLELMVELE